MEDRKILDAYDEALIEKVERCCEENNQALAAKYLEEITNLIKEGLQETTSEKRENAIQYYLKITALAKKIADCTLQDDDYDKLGLYHKNLANLYRYQAELENARHHYVQAIGFYSCSKPKENSLKDIYIFYAYFARTYDKRSIEYDLLRFIAIVLKDDYESETEKKEEERKKTYLDFSKLIDKFLQDPIKARQSIVFSCLLDFLKLIRDVCCLGENPITNDTFRSSLEDGGIFKRLEKDIAKMQSMEISLIDLISISPPFAISATLKIQKLEQEVQTLKKEVQVLKQKLQIQKKQIPVEQRVITEFFQPKVGQKRKRVSDNDNQPNMNL
jgi:hypothetical protein